jgi:plasmid stability protein
MKYATIALFLGVISAQEFDDELAEALKISITPAGQRAIEAEARDVKQVAMKIKNSQPVRNLEASLKRWFNTREMHNIEKLDKAFLASPEGKRLVAEWKDVGELLKKHLKK